MKKVFYARPVNLDGSEQENRDVALLQNLGFEVVNPNAKELKERYKKEGMDVFLQIVSQCEALAFRSFPDSKISAGVNKEIAKAQELNLDVIELPNLTENRVLTVDDTRSYLKLIGSR